MILDEKGISIINPDVNINQTKWQLDMDIKRGLMAKVCPKNKYIVVYQHQGEKLQIINIIDQNYTNKAWVHDIRWICNTSSINLVSAAFSPDGMQLLMKFKSRQTDNPDIKEKVRIFKLGMKKLSSLPPDEPTSGDAVDREEIPLDYDREFKNKDLHFSDDLAFIAAVTTTGEKCIEIYKYVDGQYIKSNRIVKLTSVQPSVNIVEILFSPDANSIAVSLRNLENMDFFLRHYKLGSDSYTASSLNLTQNTRGGYSQNSTHFCLLETHSKFFGLQQSLYLQTQHIGPEACWKPVSRAAIKEKSGPNWGTQGVLITNNGQSAALLQNGNCYLYNIENNKKYFKKLRNITALAFSDDDCLMAVVESPIDNPYARKTSHPYKIYELQW